MEIMLRCVVRDQPGALAALAGAIGSSGGDIHAVDVVEHAEGQALDDLVVVLSDQRRLADVLARVEALDDVEIVHVGPSRGHPGDAVSRLAIGLQTVLAGAQDPEQAVTTLLGGLLRAHAVTLVPAAEAPPDAPKQLVVPFGQRAVVLERAYRFTETERWRARVVGDCLGAAGAARQASTPASRSG